MAKPTSEQKRQRWEYFTRSIDFNRGESIDLNELGDSGWELVSVVILANGMHEFYFMRALE